MPQGRALGTAGRTLGGKNVAKENQKNKREGEYE